MADTDPFGRVKGEDPLKDMGWAAGETAAAHTVPTEVTSAEAPDAAVRRQAGELPSGAAPSGVPGRRRRSSNVGCAFSVVVLGFIVAVFAVVVPAAIEGIDSADVEETRPADEGGGAQGRDGSDGTGGAEERDGSEGDEERPARPARPPRGLERASLLRRGNLAPALRRLRRLTKSSRVDLIRIDAQSIVVTVPLSGGRTRLARATWDGEGEVVSTSPGGGGRGSYPWSAIDPSAPNRIVRAATRGRSSSSFDYLVLIDAAGLRWSAFLKRGGGTFSASPDGSAVSRIG
jgi:hypothetical protein